ncbi:MAG: two-component system response regulator [Desulfuromonas sp.]|nr:MAG: two-component system response regulator [Desulfuromonas sp.]
MVKAKSHLLIIDDCSFTLEVMKDQLTRAGYEVSIADNVVYSNDLIYGSNPPSLILLDVLMPLMGGDRKVEMLKRRSKSKEIPVVLMSSLPVDQLQAKAQEVGADAFLHKPISEEALLEMVGRFMQKG